MAKYSCIAKGVYQYPQPQKFISANRYMFVEGEARRGLLIRFKNELGYPVDCMDYTVIQLDRLGNTVKTSSVSHRNISFGPRATFMPSEAIPVEEECVDFKVVFHEVISGNYRYTVKRGIAVAEHIRLDENTYVPSFYQNEEPLSVTTKKTAPTSSVIWTLTAAIIIIISVILSYIAVHYIDFLKDYSEKKSHDTFYEQNE